MGLMLSLVISYAGVNEAIECLKHIISGVLPFTDPDFQDVVDYYTMLLQKSANPATVCDWTRECGQGFLSLTEDKNGNLKTAAVKYYEGQPNSTAILFSTKISSFGDSVDELSQVNSDYRDDRYIQAKTTTIISDTSKSLSVGHKNTSPTSCENISDPNRFSLNAFGRAEDNTEESNGANEKLKWLYRPKSPTPQTMPEINYQSYDGDVKGDTVYTEEFLRSLDGIKFRPLQRSDPSGRRRSFKKRQSSSSASSKDSRASREEELKIFTSLEEAEFERMNKDEQCGAFRSTPNLAVHSYSRSRSRENSRERRSEHWSVEASVDSTPDEEFNTDLKPKLKDLSKLDSFQEEKEEPKDKQEVTEEEEDDLDDFWGNNED